MSSHITQSASERQHVFSADKITTVEVSKSTEVNSFSVDLNFDDSFIKPLRYALKSHDSLNLSSQRKAHSQGLLMVYHCVVQIPKYPSLADLHSEFS